MLLYRSQFPIRETCSPQEIFEVAKYWICNSPHYKIKEKIELLDLNAPENHIEFGNESLTTINFSDEKSISYVGIDFIVHENEGLNWNTKVVGKKDLDCFWASIEVYCESTIPGIVIPMIKPPIIVKNYIERLGGGMDGFFQVLSTPYNLRDSDISDAASIMNGKSSNRIPVVYLSCKFDSKLPINPTILAKKLCGTAHVFVEPNRSFSQRLKIETHSQNVYGGAVGIYWPDGIGKEVLFQDCDHNEFINKIIATCQRALLGYKLPKGLSFYELEGFLNAKKIEEIKKSGNRNLDQYIETFDKEICLQKNTIKDLESENANLKKQLYRQTQSRPVANVGLINIDEIQELFPYELYDTIVDAINLRAQSTVIGNRDRDVLLKILQMNPKKGSGIKFKQKIVDAFKGKKELDREMRSQLERLGFSISEDGPHYKVELIQDNTYSWAIPKTPSDIRSMENNLHKFLKKILITT